MNKLWGILMLLGLVVLPFGAAAVGIHSTASGIRHAVIDAGCDTFIMQGKDLIIFAWSRGSGYAFAVFQENGQVLRDLSQFRNATSTNVREMASFARYLEQNGYSYITPDKLPAWIYEAITGTEMYLLATGASIPMVSLMMLPVTVVSHPTWLPVEVAQ
jgi:hypothetical protein